MGKLLRNSEAQLKFTLSDKEMSVVVLDFPSPINKAALIPLEIEVPHTNADRKREELL